MTGPGWNKLIDPLIAACEAEGVHIAQIKEKFGGLRFYTGAHQSLQLSQMIDEAEKKSFHVCERCGSEGKLRTNRSWIKTLCEKCNE